MAETLIKWTVFWIAHLSFLYCQNKLAGCPSTPPTRRFDRSVRFTRNTFDIVERVYRSLSDIKRNVLTSTHPAT